MVAVASPCVSAPGGSALAMLLEASSESTTPVESRQWYSPERVPVPAEPGRLATNALINVARRARRCRTRGDDRIETRGYAVKRVLWRWACAQRSGRFACSIGQLVVALAPIMGWGPAPAGRAARERWVRAHRKSVERWLDDLQVAGLLSYEGERDNRGQLWRTVITLHAAPAPPTRELRWARERMRAWKHRGRRRQRRRRPPRRSLEAIRRCSQRPQRASRACLARQRACQVRERRRRAAVEARIAGAHEKKDPTHPFGAPPTSETYSMTSETSIEFETFQTEGQASLHSAQTVTEAASLAVKSGARERENTIVAGITQPKKECTEKEGREAPSIDPWVGLEARIAARRAASAWRRHEVARQALRRAVELANANPGRGWGLGRLREAWVVFRFGAELRDSFDEPRTGPELVGDHGAGDAGRARAGQLRRAADAIALYEAFADQRPPGWPAAGAGALCVLAAQQRAATLEGDVARLRCLAKDMRASALHADAERVARAAQRAKRRGDGYAHRVPPGAPRLAFRHARTGERPRFETAELRRLRVRDELLGAGEHPGLSPNVFRAAWEAAIRHDAGEPGHGDPMLYRLPDGITQRAQRYHREITEGRWTSPPGWPGHGSENTPQRPQQQTRRET